MKDENGRDVNPYYLYYCRFHGETVEGMKKRDFQTYPGGQMCGFIIWITRARAKFFGEHPELGGVKRQNDETVERFIKWLGEWIDEG